MLESEFLMKLIYALIVVCLVSAAAWGQAAPSAPSAEPNSSAVVAVFDDGTPFTYGELKIFLSTLPPQNQQAAMRDRKALINQFALMRKLAMLAEKNKLHERSPSKEMLAYHRMQVLLSAQINHFLDGIRVSGEEIEKYYAANTDSFRQVRVKAIYISFVAGQQPAGEKKVLSEAEARIKIEKILKEIRAGADFVEMVKKHSEDETSMAKDGDFGNIRPSDNLPDAVRKAIFALKEGEVSEPVRQPNGFYLFRVEKIVAQPLDQVRDQVFNQLKQQRFRQWMEEMQASAKVTFPEDAPAAPERK